MAPVKKIDLNIDVDVLTPGVISEVVNAILEFLLFQRNQIPFVYKIYRGLVNQWSPSLDNSIEDNNSVIDFKQIRQRKKARETKDAISQMRQLIYKSFETNAVKCIRFLFGATTFTPKEAYTIHIPVEVISKKHSHENHPLTLGQLNRTMFSLLTCEELYAIFSNNLSTTNVYLELEMVETKTGTNMQMFSKEISKLPISCKDVNIHLQHKKTGNVEPTSFQCCKELEIFEDILRLSICEKEEKEEMAEAKQNLKIDSENAFGWWEAEIVIHGFKEQVNKKSDSIWTN